MLVHRRVTPSSKFAGTHLYTWVERGTMRVEYLAQEHNAVPRPGLEPGPPDPESSALTIRPPRLPLSCSGLHLYPAFSHPVPASFHLSNIILCYVFQCVCACVVSRQLPFPQKRSCFLLAEAEDAIEVETLCLTPLPPQTKLEFFSPKITVSALHCS